jgi:uncharacterized membrane protein YjgN (DUF898 family)
MKNYFKFNLTGQKLLPVWLFYMFLFLISYICVQVRMQSFNTQPNTDPHEAMQHMSEIGGLFGITLLLMIVRYAISFFIAKMSIEDTEFKLKNFEFGGQFGEFIGMIILGFFLTIITLGIYSPWFIKKVYDFFSENTAHDSSSFKFNGKGLDLFGIITLFIVAIIFLIILFFIITIGSLNHASTSPGSIGILLLILVAIIPYLYFITKWSVNFTFKGYTIKMETKLWKSLGKIALELLLSVITLGIYSPLAYLKVYQYFAENTFAESEEKSKTFGYDMEAGSDFLFIWGQLLLSIITLGFYFPWAYCKVADRIMSKTYSEDLDMNEFAIE